MKLKEKKKWVWLAFFSSHVKQRRIFSQESSDNFKYLIRLLNFFCALRLFRATTSVSWVHQRRRTLTGCFAVSWEPFTYSVKLSTQLRSLPFTSLVQDTRWDGAHVLPHLPLYFIILCTLCINVMHCLAGWISQHTRWLHSQCYLMLSLPVHIVS